MAMDTNLSKLSGKIAVAGATGVVGREMLAILADRNVPAAAIVALASARSTGTELPYAGTSLRVAEITADAFAGVDIALFSAGAGTAREFIPQARGAGATVIDNSSAFRMDPDVPLVVPEINGRLVGAGSLIANPNCSAIILVTALDALETMAGIERLVVSTYQAASGAGAAAMNELETQTRDLLAGKSATPEVFAEPCAFNVFSHDTPVDAATGLNVEEQKVIEETRKIWQRDDLKMSVTCVRVPVLRAHCESINLTLKEPTDEAGVRDALARSPGLEVVDDRQANDFPTSLKASGRDNVLVGRIRADHSQRRDGSLFYGFQVFIAGDQLRKGAALNAVQIAELAAGSP